MTLKGITSLVNDTSKAAFLEALKFSSALNKQVVEDAVKRAVEQSKGQINESLGITNSTRLCLRLVIL